MVLTVPTVVSRSLTSAFDAAGSACQIWLKTGSARSYRILKQLGVDPAAAAHCAFAH